MAALHLATCQHLTRQPVIQPTHSPLSRAFPAPLTQEAPQGHVICAQHSLPAFLPL